jgi:sugar O-acyltransferase (sialic acid O-acetyltransferase NeuD family)
MNKRLILVGGGGFGRELINWSLDVAKAGLGPSITAFIDDNSFALDGFNYDLAYLGQIDQYLPQPGDLFVISVGDPEIKQKIYQKLTSKGAVFTQLIHPTAVIARSAKLGEGIIVCPFALVSADSVIGKMVAINGFSSVGHDVVLGDFCTLSAHVDLMGSVQVGESVFFGSGARVLPKVTVKARARIGAGTVILRTVGEDSVMYAQPAKKL